MNLRHTRLALLAAAFLLLSACGGGGGSTEVATPQPEPTNPHIVDDPTIYSEPGTDIVAMYVTIRPEDNLPEDADDDCAFIGDGEGTTLEHVHQDIDGSDKCKPELNVLVSMAGLPDHGGAPNAEMRIRGATSRFASQKSYRIKLDSKEPADLWRGQRTLQLMKQPYELTRMRNKLSYDLMKDIPHITSLRTQLVQLFVKQTDGSGTEPFVDFGLYTQVEKVDDYFLAAHGLDENGTVYKAEFFEWRRYASRLKAEDDPTFDEDAFEEILEIEEGDGDHTPLLRMLDAVNDHSNDFAEVFDTYFNEQNFLTWLAINILFVNRDTNSQNFFLYNPDGTDAWYLLPWDYDGAWDWHGQPIQAPVASIGRWQRSVANWWNARLQQRYLKLPGATERLRAKLLEIKDTYATPAIVGGVVDSLKGPVRSLATAEPDLYDLPAADTSSDAAILAEYDGEVARLSTIVEDAYQNHLATIDRPMPVFLADEVVGDEIQFRWSPSYDLQGDALQYDFELSTTPSFDAGTIVASQPGLIDTFHVSYPLMSLATGTYYFRVIIREVGDPDVSWQTAFDRFEDAGATSYFGVQEVVIE